MKNHQMKVRTKKLKVFLHSFYFLIFPVLYSCNDRPSVVLDEDKMVQLMADMEIAEAYTTQQSSLTSEKRIELGRQILELHGVSEETLDTTLAWYGRNIDDYSKLFEKVDKEINSRKEKYVEKPVEALTDLANLWPYSSHLEISPLSGSESLVFSFSDPEINKGEIVNLNFAMSRLVSGKGILGVEYSDGSGESTISNFNNKKSFKIDMQSDTAKSISRLYGIMMFKELEKNSLYLDSINISLLPVDTVNYKQKRRSQKSYGIMREREKPVVKDTLPTDSLNSIQEEIVDSKDTKPLKLQQEKE